jgi:hypothetical protein
MNLQLFVEYYQQPLLFNNRLQNFGLPIKQPHGQHALHHF